MKSSRLTRVAVTAGTAALLVLGATAGTAAAGQKTICKGAAAAGSDYFALEAGSAEISEGSAFAALKFICKQH
ncbi:hypothetical protein [Streptomyces specialis]|uniref:hypothetical protein n=1 Tax=Streptomyces specialis TaxID=498367 RepID=UPI00073F0522|nr:hypothetical protein [Streptomyces specialis]